MSAPPAQDRLARLLAIVPWVAANDGPTIVEVCSRFALSEQELLADLDLLFLCGVHPFTPDTLIEVDVADGRVWIRFADYFRRPLRLTAPEGLALLGAGAALSVGSGGGGALARAIAKLEEMLGVGRDETVDIVLGTGAPEVLAALHEATATSHKVEIDYYSFGRDGRSRRTVQPWRVHNSGGQWYLDGWCDQADAERLFRVDRISSVALLDAIVDVPIPANGRTGSEDLYHPDPADPLVVVDLAPAAQWIAEQYPNEGAQLLDDGRLRVRLRASGKPWLERVLLRAGTDAELVEGDGEIRTSAANRILRRYQPGL